MAHSTAADLAAVIEKKLSGGGFGGANGGGFGDGGGPAHWRVPGRAYSTGAWLALAAVAMVFAALTSTMVVRQGSANDWAHTTLPRILYLNTLVLVISSVTLERARRLLRAQTLLADFPESAAYSLYSTLILGLLFVAGQLLAWRTLVDRGLYLASNPASSSFYLLTGMHGLHLLGGVLVLSYLVLRMRVMPRRKLRACLGAAAIYWHFMAALWIYILVLLAVKL
jgi:cytochrome c oxidase subunit III